MKVNDTLIVTIEGMDHQGRGIAHLDGMVIFIFDALIGEQVEIKILKVKKRFAQAISTSILKKSNDRIVSPCPYFKECGGCDLLHMSYQNQLLYKENKVKEIMKKFASLENVVEEIIPNEEVFRYRNKVIFQVDQEIGFYQKRSGKVVPISGCLLLSNKMNQILSILKKSLDIHGVKQIMMRETELDFMVVFDVDDNFSVSQIPSLYGISILIKRKDKYELIDGEPYLLEKIDDYIFKISPDSFFQVNTLQMKKLYQIVKEKASLTGLEKVLDLYCGTGTIGLFLSRDAKEVLGIEVNESAIKDANINRQYNRVNNIRFICGDSGRVLKESHFIPDLIVVDPARSGLEENAIVEIQKLYPCKLIYVSCDPVTLARDIQLLKNNYEVISIIPVDMFSNTYHIECVCVLNRR